LSRKYWLAHPKFSQKARPGWRRLFGLHQLLVSDASDRLQAVSPSLAYDFKVTVGGKQGLEAFAEDVMVFDDNDFFGSHWNSSNGKILFLGYRPGYQKSDAPHGNREFPVEAQNRQSHLDPPIKQLQKQHLS